MRYVAPSRVRGLKHYTHYARFVHIGRTLTGAWIETSKGPILIPTSLVAPSRVRGLKLFSGNGFCNAPSRTLTGAWIETGRRHSASCRP